MALYGRSDVMSVTVPATAGGCGVIHSRPVADGVPAEDWDLERTCAKCAATRKGDPLWSASLAEVPETPDERKTREDAEKRGERAIKKAQEQLSVRQHELTEKIVQLLAQKEIGSPPPGPYGSTDSISEIVAREVAKALAGTQQNPVPEAEPEPVTVETAWTPEQMLKLHVKTLGKMCRDRGLEATGSKADLVARLTAE